MNSLFIGRRIVLVIGLVTWPFAVWGTDAQPIAGTGFINLVGTTNSQSQITQNLANVKRLIWDPITGSMRFGALSSGANTYWNSTNLGAFSFAGGYNAKAAGAYSFAFGLGAITANGANVAMGMDVAAVGDGSMSFGYGAVSNGTNSFANGNQVLAEGDGATSMGYYTIASGWTTVAMGDSTFASGDSAVALGAGTDASGTASFAAGWGSAAWGAEAVAFGYDTEASGSCSLAAGNQTHALGHNSFAMGQSATATGWNTASIGAGVNAAALNGIALGKYNVALRRNLAVPSPTQASSDDPIFEIGIGSDSAHCDNALTIYRDGEAVFSKKATFRGQLAFDISAVVSGVVTTPDGIQGGSNGLSFSAGGEDKNITLTSSGTGATVINGPINVKGGIQQWQDIQGSVVSVVGATGNIGIGTADTTEKLNIDGGSLKFYTDATGIIFPSGERILGAESGGISFQTAEGAPRITVTSSGNVGIGTTAVPQAKLEVAGELRVSGTGNTIIKGPILIERQGDISMGDFTAGDDPATL